MTDEPLLATIPETCAELRSCRTKVYELMNTGELESIKIGDSRRIVRASIKRLVKRLMKQGTAA